MQQARSLDHYLWRVLIYCKYILFFYQQMIFACIFPIVIILYITGECFYMQMLVHDLNIL